MGVSKTPTRGRGRGRGRGVVFFFFFAIYLEIGFFWSKSIVTICSWSITKKTIFDSCLVSIWFVLCDF